MPNWEKVIKALDHHRSTAVCDGCPYENEADTIQGYCPIYDDAISLLREREPVEPDAILTNPVCGVCHEPLDVTDEYCRHCGRAVKWRA